MNAPSAIEGLAAISGDRRITVTFSAPSSEDPSIDRYEYSLDGGSWQAFGDGDLSLNPKPTFTITNLTNGVPIAVNVRGVNARGAGSDGSTASATPMEPQQLAASRHHSLVLSGPNVFVWGNDDKGQLGNGSIASVNALTLVQPSEAFSNLSTGDGHTLALTESGELWSWGDDDEGQLGNGPGGEPKNAPTRVMLAGDAPRFTRISAGGSHSLAIDRDGQLWSWGSSAFGAVGNGNQDSQVDLPVKITTTSDPQFMTVSAGYDHSLALDVHGGLWSWGGNFSGQVGNGNKGNNQDVLSPTQVSVSGNPVFTDVKAGQYNSLALDIEGNLWGWGQEFATSFDTPVPTQLTDVEQGDRRFVRIAAGYDHALAVDQEGKLHSWGNNVAGELGHGDTTDRNTPTQITVQGQPSFIRVTAGANFSVALDTNGTLWTWGKDDYGIITSHSGKLGRGSAGSSSVPIAITTPTIVF